MIASAARVGLSMSLAMGFSACGGLVGAAPAPDASVPDSPDASAQEASRDAETDSAERVDAGGEDAGVDSCPNWISQSSQNPCEGGCPMGSICVGITHQPCSYPAFCARGCYPTSGCDPENLCSCVCGCAYGPGFRQCAVVEAGVSCVTND
jgi:hypothetical protein